MSQGVEQQGRAIPYLSGPDGVGETPFPGGQKVLPTCAAGSLSGFLGILSWRRACLLWAAFLLSVAPAAAGLNRWTRSGPGAGTIYSVVLDPFHPDTVYAGHSLGVHTSADGGRTWSAASSGLPLDMSPSSQNLAADPHHRGTLFASCGIEGIYKSVDAGANWRVVNPSLSWAVIVLDPVQPDLVYAGSFGGVYRSADGGRVWRRTPGGLPDVYVSCLVVDPLKPATLYAGTRDGLYKTGDSGGQWSMVLAAPNGIQAVAVDPKQPSRIYAGTESSLVESTDGGLTWRTILEGGIRQIVVDPNNQGRLYVVGSNWFYQSRDGGESWDCLGPAGADRFVCAAAVSPFSPETVYAAAFDGLHRSLDAGANWERLGLSAPTGPVFIDNSQPSRVYVGCRGGVSCSRDGGRSWTFGNMAGVSMGCYALAGDPSNPSLLYAAASEGRLFRSLDGGQSWSILHVWPSAAISVTSIVSDGQGALYVGTNPSGVFRSPDGGETWTAIESMNQFGLFTNVTCLMLDREEPNRLYAGVGDAGLFRSVNGGESWESIGAEWAKAGVTSVVPNPRQPATLFACGCGIWKTLDGGDTFSSVFVGSDCGNNSLAIDGLDENTVYSSDGNAVFRSWNGGGSWFPINGGLRQIHLKFLSAGTGSPSRLYILEQYGDLFSIDLGDGDLDGDSQVDEADEAVLKGFLAGNLATIPQGVEAAELAVAGPPTALDLLLIRLRIEKKPIRGH